MNPRVILYSIDTLDFELQPDGTLVIDGCAAGPVTLSPHEVALVLAFFGFPNVAAFVAAREAAFQNEMETAYEEVQAREVVTRARRVVTA
jgi:hypothetical protein